MDFYVLLGVRRDATLSEIRRAYRRLARRFHPDINPGDAEAAQRFDLIEQAYDTLADPARRREYDVRGAVGEQPPGSFSFEGFDFSATVGDREASTFSELFADVIRDAASAMAEGAEHGADLHCRVGLSFTEAVTGTSRTIAVMRLETCATCRGHGFVLGPEAACVQCGGHGTVRGSRGHMVFTRVCPVCRGGGSVRTRGCVACRGDGLAPRTEMVEVVFPAGVAEATQLTVAGKGNAGRRGGRTGDLFVTVDVDRHPVFSRERHDLVVEVPIALHEAVLGARIDVPTLEGPARLRVPPGTQPGQRFRLEGRGVPLGETGRRGDLVVEVRVVVPRLVDERSRELMRELAERTREDIRKHLGV